MQITPLDDGTYDVSLCYYLYMRKQPNIHDIVKRYHFELDETSRLDEHIDTSTPDAPMHIYTVDLFPDMEMGDTGFIDLYTSHWPTHVLMNCDWEIPDALQGNIHTLEGECDGEKYTDQTLRVDQFAYEWLKQHRGFELIDEEQSPYVSHLRGDPCYIGIVETAFNVAPEPRFDRYMMESVRKALSVTKFMLKNYDGLVFDEDNWIYDFDMRCMRDTIFENVMDCIIEEEQALQEYKRERREKSSLRLVR